MTPTEILKHEHQVILLVLDAVEREVRSIQETGRVHVAEAEKMADFFRNFADHLCWLLRTSVL
jgi:hemerythrin-like domain-containing protein